MYEAGRRREQETQTIARLESLVAERALLAAGPDKAEAALDLEREASNEMRTTMQSEISQLKAENASLTVENERLTARSQQAAFEAAASNIMMRRATAATSQEELAELLQQLDDKVAESRAVTTKDVGTRTEIWLSGAAASEETSDDDEPAET